MEHSTMCNCEAACMANEKGLINFGGTTDYSYRKLGRFYQEYGPLATELRLALGCMLEKREAIIFHRDRQIPVYQSVPDRLFSNDIHYDRDFCHETRYIDGRGIRLGLIYTMDTVCVISVGGRYAFGISVQSPHDRYEKAYGNTKAYDRATQAAINGETYRKPKKVFKEIRKALNAPDVLPAKFAGSVVEQRRFLYAESFRSYFLNKLIPKLVDLDYEDMVNITNGLMQPDFENGFGENRPK